MNKSKSEFVLYYLNNCVSYPFNIVGLCVTVCLLFNIGLSMLEIHPGISKLWKYGKALKLKPTVKLLNLNF